jgi:tricorn protease
VRTVTLAACGAAVLTCCLSHAADGGVGHLMRFPDIHEGTVVFTYEDDLWRLDAGQEIPRRLTRHEGTEAEAHFSPDGTRLAFTAQYDGGVDVYVMDAQGGVPVRLTWHPARDRALGWTPDGKEVLFRSDRAYPFRGTELYAVTPDGGMPRRLPVDRAGLASLAADGRRIAYNRISREERTWKRHMGGTAQNIWIGTLGQADFREVTDWEGTDNFPMWAGETVYFTSDRLYGTLNLHAYDVASGSIEPVTEFRDYDVKYPSEGPGEIVFQYAESLHVLDVESGSVKPLPVRIRSDRVPVRHEYVEAGRNIDSFRLSPDGSELLLCDRGEVIRIPAGEEEPFQVAETSASREKYAVFAPDGERMAFLSDATGEEQIWIVGAGERFTPQFSQPLTDEGKGYRMELVWGPRSERLLFADKHMKLHLVDAGTGEMTLIDQGEYDDGWYRWGIQDYVFSPDGRWVVYTKMERSLNESLFLYDTESGERHRLTGPETTDWSPSFDPGGRYLYFLSSRTLRPIMGQIDQNHVFLDTVRAYLVLLDDQAVSPFGPASKPSGDAEAPDEGDEPEPELDLDGISQRVLAVEGLEPGSYFRLEAREDGFLVLRKGEPEFLKYQKVDDRSTGGLDLVGYALSSASSQTLIEGIGNYHLSADGEKLVYRSGGTLGIVDAGSPASVGDGKLDLGRVRLKIDRQAEFLQIFDEAWRVQRDWFYDPELHGVEWDIVRDKYRRFVRDCGERSDLNYLIGEMIGELNAGHTYVFGGDIERYREGVSVGLLGVEFDTPEGAPFHRIAHIVPGVSWNPAERSPLEEPGCDVEAGDYLIAIDGREIPSSDNPLRQLAGKVGRTVEIRFSDQPDETGSRVCKIEPIASERAIRYREWVERNRRHVEERSRGKIAYLHVPNMMEAGLIEFARAFYPSYFADGLIVDDRYNTGGFVGDMIIDRLEREVWAMTKPREGLPIPNPERGFNGHMAVLVNHDTGSNGEYFAEAIKIKGLAPIIGERTWGGAIGIEPHQDLVDGAVTTPPQFAPYGLEGKWLIEGRGVEPDITVDHPPSAALAGEDPQLDRAIEFLLEQIAEDPPGEPAPPAYPVKAKP